MQYQHVSDQLLVAHKGDGARETHSVIALSDEASSFRS